MIETLQFLVQVYVILAPECCFSVPKINITHSILKNLVKKRLTFFDRKYERAFLAKPSQFHATHKIGILIRG